MLLKTSVIGLGYLGVTQAVLLAKLGYSVIGVEKDSARLAALREGTLHFFEPGLQELLTETLESGLLSFQSEISEWASGVDVHFVCVGTPTLQSGVGVDLAYVIEAVEALARFAADDSLVVGRSTVPIGTSESLRRILKKNDKTISLAWNPEFLSEGTAVRDAFSPERIVIGVENSHASKKLREIYKKLTDEGCPLIELDLPTAELVKVASNSFLALKISFINGVAAIAEKNGANTALLADAMGHDSRIGRKFLNNGLGFGGGCLPKDIKGFLAISEESGEQGLSLLLRGALEVNESRILKVLALTESVLGSLTDRKICVLGASFKPNTDDVRESPSINLANALKNRGASVFLHDPVASNNVKKNYPDLNCSNDISQALDAAEIVIIATEWQEYSSPENIEISGMPKNKIVIDARSFLDLARWETAGWRVLKLGTPL